jgi:hypothetical protein
VIVPIDNSSETAVLAFTSTNGGSSWSNAVTLSDIQFHQPAGGLRADPFISADMDAAGTVYIVWSDCRFVANCAANNIVLLTLTPGSTTPAPSAVKRILLNQPTSSLPDYLIPNIAVDKATSGSNAHLKLTYYYYPDAACTVTTCDLDVDFFSCIGGPTNCSSQLQLAGPMKLTWLPKTDQVHYPCSPNCWMVGDYISTSIVNGHAFPVFAKATAPSGGLFNEAMFVASGLESGAVKLTQLSSDPYQKEG